MTLRSDPIPIGYTIYPKVPPCDTCIALEHCPVSQTIDIIWKRRSFPAIWDGGGMLPSYPEDMPECKYHMSQEEFFNR